MRILGITLGIALFAGAAIGLRLPEDADLAFDAAAPGKWADLGDSLLDRGERDKAGRAYQRALELAPGLPNIWIRDANFHFQLGDIPGGLKAAVQAMRLVDAYDDILFSYFDRLVPDARTVLAQIGEDPRAARAYTEHLIGNGDLDNARIVWNELHKKDARLTTQYIDALLSGRRYDEAHALGCASLCNGGFEKEPSGSALDWRIQASDNFETVRDNTVAQSGKWSLRIRFQGTENVNYANVSQTAILGAGSHHLRAWVRGEDLTTNEGPRLEVLSARSDPLVGTFEWKPIDLDFVVKERSAAVQVRVIRTPSMKFDNKIGGTLWLDSMVVQ